MAIANHQTGTSYKAGDVVMRSEPWVYTLHPSAINEYCYSCLKCLNESLIKCPGCDYPQYCSTSCLERDSESRHLRECKYLKSILNRALKITHNVLMMLKVLLRVKNNELTDGGICEPPPPTERTYLTLLSHFVDIKQDSARLEIVQTAYNELVEKLRQSDFPDLESLDKFITVYGKIRINTYDLRNELLQRIGEGCYLGPSCFDHACRANCTYLFDGTNLVVKAIEDIPDFESARFCYGECLTETENRRKQFNEYFYFCCQCHLCGGSDGPGKPDENQLEAFNKATKVFEEGRQLMSSLKYPAALECFTQSTPVFAMVFADFDLKMGLQYLTLALLQYKVHGPSADVLKNAEKARGIFEISDGSDRALYKCADEMVHLSRGNLKNSDGHADDHAQTGRAIGSQTDLEERMRRKVDELLPVIAGVFMDTYCFKTWANYISN